MNMGVGVGERGRDKKAIRKWGGRTGKREDLPDHFDHENHLIYQ